MGQVDSDRFWKISKYLTRRRLIAIGLITLALVVDAWGYWEYAPLNSSPTILVPAFYTDSAGYYSAWGLPTINFHAKFIFTAYGALSVNNPIHIHAELYNAANTSDNIPNDFLNYYDAIGFTDAFDANLTSIPVESIEQTAAIPLKQGPYNNPTSCPGKCPSIESCPSSLYYCADGDVVWVRDGSSWDFLWPTNRQGVSVLYSRVEAEAGTHDYQQIEAGNVTILCPGDPECRPPVVTISGVGDTLSVQNNLTIQRLTFILIGFSIILLLEIVDTIVSEPTREARRQPR